MPESSVGLWPSSEKGRYIVTKAGALTPIISCGHFVLVNDALYRFLSQNIFNIRFEPAWIEDKVKQTRTDGYWRLFTENSSTIPDRSFFDTKGKVMWLANEQYIFISGELKLLLENNPIKGIYLSAGFGLFAN
jgi:hypothetical protein